MAGRPREIELGNPALCFQKVGPDELVHTDHSALSNAAGAAVPCFMLADRSGLQPRFQPFCDSQKQQKPTRRSLEVRPLRILTGRSTLKMVPLPGHLKQHWLLRA